MSETAPRQSLITLRDGDLAATIDPQFGNNLFSLKLRDREFLWTPPNWRSQPALGGIPLLAPWANRIDGDSYYINGRRYRLNPDLENFRRDANGLPIHGLFAFTDRWNIGAQSESMLVTSLHVKHPDWLAQFPFNQWITITYRLHQGALLISVKVYHHSAEPMPLSLGFHPYFQLPDSSRDDWRIRIPARKSAVLSDQMIPTGEFTLFDPEPWHPLRGTSFDSVYCDLTGDTFVAECRTGPTPSRLAVGFGPQFPVGIVYAPADKNCVCFEPMTALTNAFNLDHAGKNAFLTKVDSGSASDTWRENFWIRPELL